MDLSVNEIVEQLPVVTRVYLLLASVCTILCQLDFLSPLNLYYNPRLVVKKYITIMFTKIGQRFGDWSRHLSTLVPSTLILFFTYFFCNAIKAFLESDTVKHWKRKVFIINPLIFW